jgi:hypothetical protein
MFTVLMCADCQAARGHSSGPYPVMTRAQLRRPGCAAHLGAGIEGGPHRQLIAVMRQRPAAGEQVARMYQEPGLAWLERQADVPRPWSLNVGSGAPVKLTSQLVPSAIVAERLRRPRCRQPR